MLELLADGGFWRSLYADLESARERVYMQFMTFEGDETGLELAEKLVEVAGRGVEVKVLIDGFTDMYVSDTLYLKEEVGEEVAATKKMIEDMRSEGVQVIRSHPLGPGNIFVLARNHKKRIIIDDSVYVGGINISDHNRSWHDFMVKVTDSKTVDAAVEDYLNDFAGVEKDFESENIYTNKCLERKYHELVEGANEEVIISSPYIVDVSLIRLLKNRRFKAKLLTLAKNNWPMLEVACAYVYRRLCEEGVDVMHYMNFSHSKFLIVDRKRLLVGSSNFGKESFWLKKEIGLLIEDESFIEEFLDKMVGGEQFTEFEPKRGPLILNRLSAYLGYLGLFVYSRVIAPWVKPIE